MSARSELDSLIGAIRFFTRLSVPGPLGHSGVSLERAIRYFPAAGLIVGGVAALAYSVCSLAWPRTLAVSAAIAVGVVLTGALHEDGWNDMVDGFGGGHDRDKILSIMRDSAVGSFGAIALVLLLLGRFFALVEIDPARVPAALVAGHALSRLCATCIHSALDYARPEGKAKAFDKHPGVGGLSVAALTALLPLSMLPTRQAVAGAFFALCATLWLARLFKRRIGGYTGDCLGATQQLAEVAFYFGLLCRFS